MTDIKFFLAGMTTPV